MKIILYHGSRQLIKRPVYGFGKRYNDYGLAFYCTESLSLAKEWGSSLQEDGFANCYELETDGLDILNLNDPSFSILTWLALLLDNRLFDLTNPIAQEGHDYLLSVFLPDYKKRDLIRGYRADDSYFSYAQDFLNNAISFRQLSQAMKLGKLGEQYAVKSPKAFARLRFLGYEKAEHTEWFQKRSQRDLEARKDYASLRKGTLNPQDLFMRDFLLERIKPDDPRLR
jgi:hypothetical protein